MRIAVSNIAWPVAQDDAVGDALFKEGVTGIEVAPTKVWPNPIGATEFDIKNYRRQWENRGISIVAAQSLLFGRPELSLFESPEIRGKTLNYLRVIVELCASLGAQCLVFGAPKNRRVGNREPQSVWPEAVEFFGRLAEHASAFGTTVVLEANPKEYGADFLMRAAEALKLVREVNHIGLRLHLDTACMALAGDTGIDFWEAIPDWLAHFHVSEPHLGSIRQSSIDHTWFAQRLREVRYAGWVSLEMREPEPFDLSEVLNSVRIIRSYYGD